jgi:hypothetical protein
VVGALGDIVFNQVVKYAGRSAKEADRGEEGEIAIGEAASC